MSDPIQSYRDLQRQIHDDLRRQHPDWVEPNGDCPICDSYEARLADLLGLAPGATAVSKVKLLFEVDHPAAA